MCVCCERKRRKEVVISHTQRKEKGEHMDRVRKRRGQTRKRLGQGNQDDWIERRRAIIMRKSVAKDSDKREIRLFCRMRNCEPKS